MGLLKLDAVVHWSIAYEEIVKSWSTPYVIVRVSETKVRATNTGTN